VSVVRVGPRFHAAVLSSAIALAFLGACGGASRPATTKSAAKVVPPGPTEVRERFEDRFVLVKLGAKLHTAADDRAPVVHDDAWTSSTSEELGRTTVFRLVRTLERYVEIETMPNDASEVHCAPIHPSFAGLALRFFVERSDLANVLLKPIRGTYKDGSGIWLLPGIEIGPVDPRLGGPDAQLRTIHLHGRQLIAPIILDHVATSYRPASFARKAATRELAPLARPRIGGGALDFGFGSPLESRLPVVETATGPTEGSTIATIRLPCADLRAIVAPSDVREPGHAEAAARLATKLWARPSAPASWMDGRAAGHAVDAVALSNELASSDGRRCFRMRLTPPWQPALSLAAPQKKAPPSKEPKSYELCFAAVDVVEGETAPREPSASATTAPEIDVVATWPATVMHALDAFSGMVATSADYRSLPPKPDPEWLVRYRAWRARESSFVSGLFSPQRACAFDAIDLADLDRCLAMISSEADLAALRPAIAGASRVLEQSGRLNHDLLAAERAELEALLRRPGSREALEILRLRTALTSPQRARVVLVARPWRRGHGNGHSEGRYALIEASLNAEVDAEVVFHELGHDALDSSPERDSMDRAFAGKGYLGLVASNRLDEAFASYFAHGVAFPKVPLSSDRDVWYPVPAIDMLARGLDGELVRAPTLKVGPLLADAMMRAVERSFERRYWSISDVLDRVVVYSEAPASMLAFRRALAPAGYRGVVGVPKPLDAPRGLIVRVLLLTESELAPRPDLLALLQTSVADVRAQLASAPSAVRWVDDERGIPLVLVVARDHAALTAGAEAFGHKAVIPTPGWLPPTKR
jgi:hypothetical protein